MTKHQHNQGNKTSIDNSMEFTLIDNTLKYYESLFMDIESATRNIYIEVYRIVPSIYAEKLRSILITKAQLGVDVMLLLDAYGSASVETYFNKLKTAGGKICFFDRIKYTIHGIYKWHKRNHRKLLIIDNHISYIGSSNITNYNINWRELMVRIEDNKFASVCKNIFIQQFYEDSNMFKNELEHLDPIFVYDKYIVLRDRPSVRKQAIKKAVLTMLKKAKHKIIIETPYFLPSFLIRRELIRAIKRGVEVIIITPKQSDVGIVNILRSKYIGLLHKEGLKIQLYEPNNLHSKLIIADNFYIVSSSNFDYRSFMFQHELGLLGQEDELLNLLIKHVDETLHKCQPFDYDKWINRPAIEKVFATLLVPVRHLL